MTLGDDVDSIDLIRTARGPIAQLCRRHGGLDALLLRVGAGDRLAFSAFYDEMSPTVYGMSLASGRGPDLSAQMTLEVFLLAWQQAAAYDVTKQSAWSWLREIALETSTDRTTPRRYSHV